MAEKLRSLAGASPSRLNKAQRSLPGADALSLLDPMISAEQREAIRIALTSPVSVLTGGPGTGKTTTLKALIGVLEMEHYRYALASPTGRAAKRLSEATGQARQHHSPPVGFFPRRRLPAQRRESLAHRHAGGG